MRKLKVFGVNTFLLGKQARTIAAVTSQKKFAEAIGTTLGYIQTYACETGNEGEIRVALTHPGEVFVFCPTCNEWRVVAKNKT
jgi:hypothetical protein